MTDKEKKMERLKHRLMRIHEKIQDRVEDFQDQVQTRIEKSKLSRFVSHVSDEKSFVEDNSIEEGKGDSDDKISIGSDNVFKTVNRSNSIPSVIIDEPDVKQDTKEICKDFISVEKNAVLFKRRSLSTSNLAIADDDDSSDSCVSCTSLHDERPSEFRPRAGSLPPGEQLELALTTSASALSTCTDLIEKIGNRFPALKSRGDRIHRVFENVGVLA